MVMRAIFNAEAHMSASHMTEHTHLANKALEKLSTGLKFNNSSEDASSYAISERMRVQLRSLSQDSQNIQNGSSMIKTAERGIAEIIEEIKSLKELAINAANDSNTDEDRATIQKEFTQRMETINDIALGTEFNGKILLDGRWGRPLIEPVYNVSNMVNSFSASDNATDEHAEITDTYNYGTSGPWHFKVDKSFSGSGTFAVKLDFSAMQVSSNLDNLSPYSSSKTNSKYSDALHGQGFTVLCGGCVQYINVIFNANKSAEDSDYNATANEIDGVTNNKAREYIIGVKDVQSSDELAETIFEGVKALGEKGKITTVGNTADSLWFDGNHSFKIARNSDGDIVFTKTGFAMQFRNGVIANLDNEMDELAEKRRITSSLWIQHGIQSNQRTNVYIESMQTIDLKGVFPNEADNSQLTALSDSSDKQAELEAIIKKAKGMTLDDAKVNTREDAKIAIRVIDGALEYALNQAINLGAYLQMFEFTGANVNTMNEDVQSAESVIRDADMAKEMVNYTKYNLLSQSAQSMFAQANQNGTAILGLLQEKTE